MDLLLLPDNELMTMSKCTHPLMSTHSESLAGNGLPISNALHETVSNDGMFMLTCKATIPCQPISCCVQVMMSSSKDRRPLLYQFMQLHANYAARLRHHKVDF